jgi:hypothetical protein
MQWLFGLLTGLPGFLNGLLAYLNKRQDTEAVFNSNSKDVSIALVQAEAARQKSMADVSMAAMSHPIWWIAWSIGVFPVLTYHACVYWVSTFPSLGWVVLKVPADQIEMGHTIINWMFGISGASAFTAGIAHAWSKRA